MDSFVNVLSNVYVFILRKFLCFYCQVVEGGEMEIESYEEVGDEEIESGVVGNEFDMDLDLFVESESDSEESQV